MWFIVNGYRIGGRTPPTHGNDNDNGNTPTTLSVISVI